jgi:succinoglycan biosynthesis protein ExoM
LDLSVEISIVICTLDRHEGVARALRSCLDQDLPPDVDLEVVIVDNSQDGNAREPVMDAAAGRPNVRYVNETRTNISHARNAGVAAASGRFVAFMDDDMAAPRSWLGDVLHTMQATSADALIGMVKPDFEGEGGWGQNLPEPAEWFGRTLDVEEGGPLTNLKRTGTGNCVLRRETTLLDPTPFDPVFGRLGGEDTDFLQRLQQRGAMFVFSHKAWMTEFVPASRNTADYLALRRFRESQQFVRLVVKNRGGKKWLMASRHMAIGMVQLALASLRYGAARLGGMDAGLPRVAMAQALGKVLWTQAGDNLQPYR